MLKISDLARRFNLSRSTLLYYDRLELLSPSGRSEAGYRLYSKKDIERLESICAYREAGLSLEEIGHILDNLEAPQREVLEHRLQEIGKNIRTLQQQQQVLAKMLKVKASDTPFSQTGKQLWVEMFRAAGMDEAAMRSWHREYELRAPEDHHAFLLALDISEKEALQIRKLSANMESNDKEMDYFYRLFEQVEKCAPSSAEETLRALKLLTELPDDPLVLDIGCANGAQTLVLAEHLKGKIVAIDNHQPFLDNLKEAAEKKELSAQVTPQLASMFDLPFQAESFDLIWSEGAIYIIGFSEGLACWKPLLKNGGYLALSDMVWLRDNPPAELEAYWRENNPNMTNTTERLRQSRNAGYQVVEHFTLSSAAWCEGYYQPVRNQIARMRQELAWNENAEQVFKIMEEEADIYDRFGDWYGYEFFLLRKNFSGAAC